MNLRVQNRIAAMRRIASLPNPTNHSDFSAPIALEMMSLLKDAIADSADFFEKEMIAMDEALLDREI